MKPKSVTKAIIVYVMNHLRSFHIEMRFITKLEACYSSVHNFYHPVNFPKC